MDTGATPGFRPIVGIAGEEPFQRFARERYDLGGTIAWGPCSRDDLEDEGLASEDELAAATRPGENAQAFVGRLGPPGIEDPEDGMPIVWMRVAVNPEQKSVRRLGQGLHPGFASRLRFREALLHGDRTVKRWLARKLDAASAKDVVMAHAFAGGEEAEPSAEAMEAVEGRDFSGGRPPSAG